MKNIFKIAFLLCFPLMIACAAPMAAPVYDDAGNTAGNRGNTQLKADILDLINKHRRAKGMPAMKANGFVENVAEGHSINMASKRVSFGHDGFDDRYKELGKGIKGMQAMAENVAYGKLSAERVVDLWLNSPGHRKNIEGNYNTTGIGIAMSKDGQLYFTQLFVRQ